MPDRRLDESPRFGLDFHRRRGRVHEPADDGGRAALGAREHEGLIVLAPADAGTSTVAEEVPRMRPEDERLSLRPSAYPEERGPIGPSLVMEHGRLGEPRHLLGELAVDGVIDVLLHRGLQERRVGLGRLRGPRLERRDRGIGLQRLPEAGARRDELDRHVPDLECPAAGNHGGGGDEE